MQLHRKYQRDGLVVMSLDVLPDEWDKKDKVLKFLTDQQADFPNYIFKDDQEKVDGWQEKYDAVFLPAVVVFDRTGKRVTVPDRMTEAEEEAFVKKLLGK